MGTSVWLIVIMYLDLAQSLLVKFKHFLIFLRYSSLQAMRKESLQVLVYCYLFPFTHSHWQLKSPSKGGREGVKYKEWEQKSEECLVGAKDIAQVFLVTMHQMPIFNSNLAITAILPKITKEACIIVNAI